MTVYLSKLSHRQGGPRLGALMAAKINMKVMMLSIFCLLLPMNTMAMIATETFSIDDVKQGSLVFENAQGETALALPMQTEVSMQVSGWINRVSVRHEFKNNSSDWVNGDYLFPLPNEAAVDQLKLHIGDRVIEGQIQPKAKAKAIFEQAKAQGKKASLLEQRRPNIFSTKVANLAPNELLIVELTYQETLDYRDGEFSLRFPMVVAPRYAPEQTASVYNVTANEARALSDEIGRSTKPAEYAKYYAKQEQSSFNIHNQVSALRLISEAGRVYQRGNNNRINLKVTFDSAMPIEQIRSPYHQINVDVAEDGGALVCLQGDAIANRDFVLSWQPIQGSEPTAAVFSQVGKTHGTHIPSVSTELNLTPSNLAPSKSTAEQSSDMAMPVRPASDKYALVMLIPPQGATQHDLVIPRELILVIDTSGSMSGDAIIQAKAALKYALAGLRPQDSFNILQFNSEVEKWSDRAVHATAVNLGRAQNYINRLQANGGTEMSMALNSALNIETGIDNKEHAPNRLRQVLFITDGAVANEAMLFEQIEAQLGESRLFTIGIGAAPNAHFMQRAAQLGRGTFTYIGKLDEVNHKVVSLLEKIEKPQVTDVDLRFSDGSVPDYWPVRIPDLYADEPLLVAVKLPSYVSNDLLIQGQLAGQFWQRRLSVNATEQAKGLDLVWARKQIAALELSKQGANRERVEKQITAIAMNFHIMSAYTSLVAVDLTPSKPQGVEAKLAKVMQHLPRGWQGSLQTLPQTGTNSYVFIIFGSVLLLLAVLYRLSFRRPEISEEGR